MFEELLIKLPWLGSVKDLALEISLKLLYSKIFWCIAVFIFLVSWMRRKFSSYITIATKSERGSIQISKKALKTIIRNICTSFGITEKPKIKLFLKRRKVNCVICVIPNNNSIIGEFSIALQNRVFIALQENLGLNYIGKINIRIKGYLSEKKTNQSFSENKTKDENFSSPENNSSIKKDVDRVEKKNQSLNEWQIKW